MGEGKRKGGKRERKRKRKRGNYTKNEQIYYMQVKGGRGYRKIWVMRRENHHCTQRRKIPCRPGKGNDVETMKTGGDYDSVAPGT